MVQDLEHAVGDFLWLGCLRLCLFIVGLVEYELVEVVGGVLHLQEELRAVLDLVGEHCDFTRGFPVLALAHD